MGTCSCCANQEQHDITVESSHKPAEKAADRSDLTACGKEQEVVFESEDSEGLHAALRSYLARKQMKTISQSSISGSQMTALPAEESQQFNDLFGPPMQEEDESADYIGDPEELLAPIVRKVLHSLPRFEYLHCIKGVEQRSAKKLKDGSIYVGEWYETARFGKGKYYCIDGSFHEGYWRNGTLHYRGRVIYATGDYYEGQMNDGVREGDGKLSSLETNSSYVGQWKNDKQHGIGTETFSESQSQFIGEFCNGVKEGHGRFQWGDGSHYEGGFHSNMLEGTGHYVWADKREYEGDWLNNQMDGKGRFQWPDGRVYTGEYHCDKKEGYGTYLWEKDKVYEGYWKDGRMHGEGFLTIPGKGRRKFTFFNGKKGNPIDDEDCFQDTKSNISISDCLNG